MVKLKDKKIQIYSMTDIAEPGDMPNFVFAPIHTGTLWAYFRQLSGTEHYIAMQQQVMEEVLFRINWRNDLVTTCIVKYKGLYYDIKRIDPFEGYKDDISLYCSLALTQSDYPQD